MLGPEFKVDFVGFYASLIYIFVATLLVYVTT